MFPELVTILLFATYVASIVEVASLYYKNAVATHGYAIAGVGCTMIVILKPIALACLFLGRFLFWLMGKELKSYTFRFEQDGAFSVGFRYEPAEEEEEVDDEGNAGPK